MAKGVPKRTTTGNSGTNKTPVGYGKKGNAFTNQKNYNASLEGNRHAKNPGLSVKPVAYGDKGNAFFSKSEARAHGKLPNPQPIVPMPGHPSKNPSHIHGPAATGQIKGGAAPPSRGGVPPAKGGGTGFIPTPQRGTAPARTVGGPPRGLK